MPWRLLVPGRDVPRVARYTWARQWRAEIFAGAVDGAMGLASFVALRAFGAAPIVAALIGSFGQLFWLAAPAWEAAFARFHHRAAFLWTGLVANAPLLVVAFCDPDSPSRGAWLAAFVAVLAITSAVDAAYVPQRGALLRANVPVSVRGRLFATLSTVSRFSSVAAAKAGGFLLDVDAHWLRAIFPLAGVCGLLEHWTLSRIHWHRGGRPPRRAWSGVRSAAAAVADAWGDTLRILGRDRAFRTFEIGFTLYGLGFLMSQPMIAVFAERDLRLRYGEWTTAQGLAQPIAYVATILVAGRMVDRLGVVRTTVAAFALLASFFAVLPFVHGPAALDLCYVLFGVAMALVNLGWSLGPLAFAPPTMARTYTTAHVLCVGIRSATAPFAGWWLAEHVGLPACFAASTLLVGAACLTMAGLSRTHR